MSTQLTTPTLRVVSERERVATPTRAGTTSRDIWEGSGWANLSGNEKRGGEFDEYW